MQRVLVGDPIDAETKALGPYQSGPKLVAFFNEFGANDVYPAGGGFPSRWQYAEAKLTTLNETPSIIDAVEAVVAPARYLDCTVVVEDAVTYLNRYFGYDGLELVFAGRVFRLRVTGEPLVEMQSTQKATNPVSHEFIEEQVAKCDRKLQEKDYDGAITNARSLIEAVLYEIEGLLDPSRPAYDGDLSKLYKRVQKLLNLDPVRVDISESLRQLLGGLVNVVAGVAPLRNKMGDAHVRTYKPERHHAKLAVNAAKTLADFLIDTLEYQKRTGKLKP